MRRLFERSEKRDRLAVVIHSLKEMIRRMSNYAVGKIKEKWQNYETWFHRVDLLNEMKNGKKETS